MRGRENQKADERADLADQQYGPAANPIRQPPEIGSHQLAQRVDRDQHSDYGRRRTQALRVERQQRQISVMPSTSTATTRKIGSNGDGPRVDTGAALSAGVRLTL